MVNVIASQLFHEVLGVRVAWVPCDSHARLVIQVHWVCERARRTSLVFAWRTMAIAVEEGLHLGLRLVKADAWLLKLIVLVAQVIRTVLNLS